MKSAGTSAILLGLLPGLLPGLGLMSIGTANAAPPARCHAEVLRSEELPYAPIGDWLVKATIRVTPPHGPAVVSTFLKNSPRHMTVRRGDRFWFDCERLRDAWLVSAGPTQ